MKVEVDDILYWVESHDVSNALQWNEDVDSIRDIVVKDRLELASTAAGVALLNRYNRAKQEADIAKKALTSIGVYIDNPEENDDRIIIASESDFYLAANDIGINSSIGLTRRLWLTLKRTDGILRFYKQEEDIDKLTPEQIRFRDNQLAKLGSFDGLFVGSDEISVTKLNELVEADLLTTIRGLGPAQVNIAKRVVSNRLAAEADLNKK